MQTIINRSPLTISIDTDGAITVTLNSAPLAMPFGTKIKALSEVKGSGTAALVAAAKVKGGTHLMGSRVALLPGEADLIAAALASHPALIAKDAAFQAECERLAAAERKINAENAWQTDPRCGFAEGAETPDRADNTPSHKRDY